MRKFPRTLLAASGCCLAFFYATATAQEAAPLPAVKTSHTPFTPPKLVDKHRGSPTDFKDPRYNYHEGVALILATVTRDGTLKDLRLQRLAGDKIFADTALDIVRDWRYEPATRNGQPVDCRNYSILLRSYIVPPERGVHNTYRQTLRVGIRQSNAGDYDASIATLLPILAAPRLNFYERGIVSLQLGLDYLHKNDDLTAREYFEQVSLIGDSYLPADMRPVLWHMAIVADANTRRYLDVRDDYKNLQALGPGDDGEPSAKLAAAAEAQIAGTDQVVAPGRIGTVSPLAAWQSPLVRHTFSIQNVSGRLDRIELVCGTHGFFAPFSDQAEWHIPARWQDCAVTVYGAPGTTFALVQTADAPAALAPP